MAVVRYRDENGNLIPLRVIQGDNGEQMFVRFSEYADGTDMSETWDDKRDYMGIAFGYKEPTDKADYQWIRVSHFPNGMSLDADNNLYVKGEVTFGKDRFSPRDALFEAVPRWNVNQNVGAISPVLDGFSFRTTHKDGSGIKSLGIPMINSGHLHLCFKMDADEDRFSDQATGAFPNFDWLIGYKVYVGDTVQREYSFEYYGISSGKPQKDHELLLEVADGDTVTIVAEIKVNNRDTGNSFRDTDWCELTISDIQLKANIATLHTYPFTLCEGLDNPTANEILDTLLGV